MNDGQNVEDVHGEGDKTHRKNTSPDIPGSVSTDAFAGSDCSSWHDLTESAGMRYLYFGREGAGKSGCGGEGLEKRDARTFYMQQARHREGGWARKKIVEIPKRTPAPLSLDFRKQRKGTHLTDASPVEQIQRRPDSSSKEDD